MVCTAVQTAAAIAFTLSDTEGTRSRHVCVALPCGASPVPTLVEADLVPFAVLRVVQSAAESVGELQVRGWRERIRRLVDSK